MTDEVAGCTPTRVQVLDLTYASSDTVSEPTRGQGPNAGCACALCRGTARTEVDVHQKVRDLLGGEVRFIRLLPGGDR